MIELITKDDCSLCQKAKNLLEINHMEFSEKKIGIDVDRDTVLRDNPGIKMLPVVYVNGNYIGGVDELSRYVNGLVDMKNLG